MSRVIEITVADHEVNVEEELKPRLEEMKEEGLITGYKTRF